MTSLEASEMLKAAPKLQIWNNDAFDDGASRSDLPPGFTNNSFNSNGSKENQIQTSVSSSLQSSVSIGCSNIQEKPLMAWCEALSGKSKIGKVKFGVDLIERGDDERDIDAEIEEVEKEICRLSTGLETLRLEKVEQNARSIAATRGKIVPAKVKIDDSSLTRSKSKLTRRGVSLGPGEISSPEKMIPLQSAQNRRRSCFWKLPGTKEGTVTKAKGRRSLTLSPKSRIAALKNMAGQKQAAMTVGSKRLVKKEEGFLSSIQPKKLFKEEEKNAASRKPGKVVASRYSYITKTQTAEKDARKRSLPKNNKEIHKSEKRRAPDENTKNEERLNTKLEIPSDVCEETPIGKELPNLTKLRLAEETPRDSGAAKRVAELESKNHNSSFCQLLRFED